MSRNDLVTYDCTLITETDAAWFMDIDDNEVWLPKSVCEYDPDDRSITMPEWMAIEKDIA